MSIDFPIEEATVELSNGRKIVVRESTALDVDMLRELLNNTVASDDALSSEFHMCGLCLVKFIDKEGNEKIFPKVNNLNDLKQRMVIGSKDWAKIFEAYLRLNGHNPETLGK
jgi:hypothetical protein